MKTLSIRQPWATLVVKGIKDIENRTWKTDYRGKILIHAGSTKIPDNIYETLPGELYSGLQNEVNFGNVEGNLNLLPTGAIIGYVDLTEIVEPGVEFESATYDGGPEFYRWIFDNAYEFDEPILGVKGKQNLYDTPEITEDNLPPAHKAKLYAPYYHEEDKTLFAPICSLFYDYVLEGRLRKYNFFTQWDTDYLNTLVCKEEEFVFPVDTIVFYTIGEKEGRYVGFEVTRHGVYFTTAPDGDYNRKKYVHTNEKGQYIYNETAYIAFCGKEVNVDKYFDPETPTPVPAQHK